MSFWAILAGCFSASKSPSRPYAQVKVNSANLSALFDTGSTYTLVNSRLKSTILGNKTGSPGLKHVQLCAANGDALKTTGSYSVDISFSNRTIKHPIIFVDKLQVDCIIGMDFMSASNIYIDTKRRKIILGKNPLSPVLTLFSKKSILLPPHAETMAAVPVPGPFSRGLLEDSGSLPSSVCLMDGVTSAPQGLSLIHI